MTSRPDDIIKGIKAIFFDYDDTLANSIQVKWAHHKHVAKTHYGKTLSDDEIRKHWTNPFSKLVGLLYGDENLERAMENNLAHEAEFPKTLFTDTVHILEQLHSNGLLTGIVTSTSRRSLTQDLARYKLPDNLVDYIQTENDTSYHKPDPRVFEPLLKYLADQKIESSQVLYVGDGLHDMKAALEAGFNFIGVTTGLVSAQQFTEAGVKSVAKLADIQDLISMHEH